MSLNRATDLPPGDYALLEISDTGCGMTEAVKAKVFDPFFTTKFAGRRLGLAVVEGIVRAHGGAIKLTSAPGEGTRFQVFLRSAQAGSAEVRSPILPAAVKQFDSWAGNILIVEDEEVLRFALSKAFGFILECRSAYPSESAFGFAGILSCCFSSQTAIHYGPSKLRAI